MPVAALVSTKTVLVADDTAFVRDRFRTALAGAGYRAITLRSGSELLLQIRDDHSDIDLVVLDLRLPHGRGVELVRAIRHISGFNAPVVVFSDTIADAEEVRALAELGIAGYVNEYTAVQHIVPALRGMGLEFTHVVEPGQRVIDDFVRSHFFSNRKA